MVAAETAKMGRRAAPPYQMWDFKTAIWDSKDTEQIIGLRRSRILLPDWPDSAVYAGLCTLVHPKKGGVWSSFAGQTISRALIINDMQRGTWWFSGIRQVRRRHAEND